MILLRTFQTIVATILCIMFATTTSFAAGFSYRAIPYPMDRWNEAAWWSPLETYRDQAGNHAYLAFNEPGRTEDTHRVSVAHRASSGHWTRLPVMDGDRQAEYVDDGGHNQPSIARDGAGRVHVFASMHDDNWRYFRSPGPLESPEKRSTEMPDFGEEVTYPVAASAPNGDVYVIARVDAWSDDSRAGRLYHWNNRTSQWRRIAKFGEALNRTVYPDDIQVDHRGHVHIIWEWSRTPSMAWRHKLSYIKYLPSENRFVDSAGNSAKVPTTPNTADVIQPFEGAEEFAWSGVAVRSAKMTLRGTRPLIAYRYRSPRDSVIEEIRYAEPRSPSNWRREVVYRDSQTTRAVDVTWDPEDGQRVYYARADGPTRMHIAIKKHGHWQHTPLATGTPVNRIAVERDASGIDVMYLVDINNLKVVYGRYN